MEIRWRRDSGFTILELLVVIATILILATILFPVLQSARERSFTLSCMNNAREIGLAAILYAQDSEDTLPVTANWYTALSESYTKNQEVFICPAGASQTLSYNMNPLVENWRLHVLPDSSKIILFGDAYQVASTQDITSTPPAFSNAAGGTDPGRGDATTGQVQYRHNNGANFVFCDGHCKWFAKGTLTFNMWSPYVR